MARKRKYVDDPLQETEFVKDFRKEHNLQLENDKLKGAVISAEADQRRRPATFGTEPLPWEVPMDFQQQKHFKAAKSRLFVCSNPKCDALDVESEVNYKISRHAKDIPFSDTGDEDTDKTLNEWYTKRLGRRTQVQHHIAAVCKSCGQRIQFVKYTLANRRAAKDPMVSGPHQGRGAF